MAVVFNWGLDVNYDDIECHDKAFSEVNTQIPLPSLENGG